MHRWQRHDPGVRARLPVELSVLVSAGGVCDLTSTCSLGLGVFVLVRGLR